jgi:sec-independent protein translocase protein TatA
MTMGFVNIGPLELLMIGVIALLVLGPKRLPEAARSLGKGVREMRQALQGNDDEDDEVYVPDPPDASPREG